MQSNGIFIFVDDDNDEHELFALAVKKLGFKNRIEFFSNGKTALEFILTTEEDIFLIFSDIHMPEMDGLEFKRAIEEIPVMRAKAIPFIFHSSSSGPSDVLRAYGLNIQGFFEKTHDINESINRLKTAVDYWSACLLPTNIKKIHK